MRLFILNGGPFFLGCFFVFCLGIIFVFQGRRLFGFLAFVAFTWAFVAFVAVHFASSAFTSLFASSALPVPLRQVAFWLFGFLAFWLLAAFWLWLFAS